MQSTEKHIVRLEAKEKWFESEIRYAKRQEARRCADIEAWHSSDLERELEKLKDRIKAERMMRRLKCNQCRLALNGLITANLIRATYIAVRKPAPKINLRVENLKKDKELWHLL